MIKKFFIYLKSDGFANAMKFTLKSITSLIYNKSITNIYHKKIDEDESNESDYDIRNLTLSDIEKLDFPRLKILPYRKWIDSGSKLYIIYINGNPAGFSWIHFCNYKFTAGLKFVINNDCCWAGPQFIHKDYRGKGLQRIIVEYCINKESGKNVYTSVSNNNIASNKCMIRNKFELIGTTHITTLFGKEIKKVITPSLNNKIVKQ